jgi:DNA-directed RNA polymerase subunit F
VVELDDEYLTLAEIKEALEKEQKVKTELLSEQKLALEHAQKFSKLKPKDAKKLVKELKAMEKVSEQMAVKIADLLPTHNDDLQALFAKERTSLAKEDMEQIMEIVRKYS